MAEIKFVIDVGGYTAMDEMSEIVIREEFEMLKYDGRILKCRS
jgi:hypothetical protein